ncbi:RHS repeat-associated core domain-containing protein [Pseudomonas sp. UBA1879]|uniref:RHS repeat-associated core domain-containing protein n=1 Tax=Pseudomonas sp. UBA1879 TaxID=1947305 RepID=UPI002600C8A1|nr:RHS repeat-associated core domain-containing protein [Pseudomonas sp. UBA1879]
MEYDLLMRVLAVFEMSDGREACVERLTYGAPDGADANQCGQLIRHDDPAGLVINAAFSLTGQVSEQTRRFLSELAVPDWPESENERDSFLEPSAGATTCWRFNAAGEATEQTDAVGNTQHFGHTASGQLKSTRLQLLNQSMQTLVSDIRYDAHNRIRAETLGNGIVTTLDYDPVDGRLRNLRADNGRLQDLHYAYGPVGNVVSVEDRAQPTRYFANQQIEPLRTFAYDTLYQLIEATGYESATAKKGPSTHPFFATDNQLSNYVQHYEYDTGGNLHKLIHTGARNHTRTFATARYSNRTLLQTDEHSPTEEQIAAGFDANGNLRELSPGQTLSWDLRNQLSEVTPVERESGFNDREIYRYDAAGARVRKVRVTQSRALTHLSEVRYLPGLQIRTNSATGEVLHVVTAQAGRSNVGVLHWETGRPTDIENNQARYSLTDHLGSSTLEVDNHGQLISHEAYFPFGETAWFAARSELEAKYKTVRYSGKERDATGLYDYGLRYYAPWLMRWINPDPQGEEGGVNLYQMVVNNPINYIDRHGEKPEVPQEIHYIWIGKSDSLPEKYLANIRDAAARNPGFNITLHTDLRDDDGGVEKLSERLGAAKNLSVTRLHDEAFFTSFSSSPSGSIYSDLFGSDPRNYAAATDVLRYSLINHYGGIYADVDDKFRRPVRSGDFIPKKNRVFTMGIVEMPWARGTYSINNNAFASHAQNSTLSTLIKEINKKYEPYRERGLGATLTSMPAHTSDQINEKMKIVSETTGPGIFTRVLTNQDSKLKKLYTNVVADVRGEKDVVNLSRHEAQIEKRMRMRGIISFGNAHSWQ